MANIPTDIRARLLPVVNKLRALPARFGLRRYAVILRRRTWSGSYCGEGTPTDVDTNLLPVPRVRPLTTKEVASSGGTYREGDFLLSAITPAFTGGGYSPTQLNLRPTGVNQDVTIILSGDEGVIECQVVEFWFNRPFTYEMVVREKRTAVGTTLG